ncbi:MAG TPA: hypothetical protein VN457_06975, partial [Chlamydiales bacterium]|nr:hypothetical protein [Chlamydiales bacterium]
SVVVEGLFKPVYVAEILKEKLFELLKESRTNPNLSYEAVLTTLMQKFHVDQDRPLFIRLLKDMPPIKEVTDANRAIVTAMKSLIEDLIELGRGVDAEIEYRSTKEIEADHAPWKLWKGIDLIPAFRIDAAGADELVTVKRAQLEEAAALMDKFPLGDLYTAKAANGVATAEEVEERHALSEAFIHSMRRSTQDDASFFSLTMAFLAKMPAKNLEILLPRLMDKHHKMITMLPNLLAGALENNQIPQLKAMLANLPGGELQYLLGSKETSPFAKEYIREAIRDKALEAPMAVPADKLVQPKPLRPISGPAPAPKAEVSGAKAVARRTPDEQTRMVLVGLANMPEANFKDEKLFQKFVQGPLDDIINNAASNGAKFNDIMKVLSRMVKTDDQGGKYFSPGFIEPYIQRFEQKLPEVTAFVNVLKTARAENNAELALFALRQISHPEIFIAAIPKSDLQAVDINGQSLLSLVLQDVQAHPNSETSKNRLDAVLRQLQPERGMVKPEIAQLAPLFAVNRAAAAKLCEALPTQLAISVISSRVANSLEENKISDAYDMIAALTNPALRNVVLAQVQPLLGKQDPLWSKTLLHEACLNDDKEIAKSLIEYMSAASLGAKSTMQNAATAFSIACEHEDWDDVSLLLLEKMTPRGLDEVQMPQRALGLVDRMSPKDVLSGNSAAHVETILTRSFFQNLDELDPPNTETVLQLLLDKFGGEKYPAQFIAAVKGAQGKQPRGAIVGPFVDKLEKSTIKDAFSYLNSISSRPAAILHFVVQTEHLNTIGPSLLRGILTQMRPEYKAVAQQLMKALPEKEVNALLDQLAENNDFGPAKILLAMILAGVHPEKIETFIQQHPLYEPKSPEQTNALLQAFIAARTIPSSRERDF